VILRSPLKAFTRRFPIPKKWVISYRSELKKKWDIAIIFLAIFNSFEIPVQQSFNPLFFQGFFFLVGDTIIDLCFVADITVMFFTSTLDKRGRESKNSELIAHSYTRTLRFYLDLLSVLGAGVFENVNRFFKYFGLFKLTRVFRISNMI